MCFIVTCCGKTRRYHQANETVNKLLCNLHNIILYPTLVQFGSELHKYYEINAEDKQKTVGLKIMLDPTNVTE